MSSSFTGGMFSTRMLLMILGFVLIVSPKIQLTLATCTNDSDCSNQGTCVTSDDISHSNDGGNYCKCLLDFVGENCAMYCPLRCANGGTCLYSPPEHAQDISNNGLPIFNDYKCRCRKGWKGPLCEEPTKFNAYGQAEKAVTNDDGKLKGGAILGIIIAVLVFLLIITCCIRRQIAKCKSSKELNATEATVETIEKKDAEVV